ncbi:MAG: DUF2291 domain-containing protein [Rhodobacteraceae bacterium CG17_big_fil_post_rev_8_21_14_2_50_65_11]|nr:MAG: DUF2291 domain-containing protein [Rhodobacteraceae bacterium CG17_big_fil_post_rev_8_21_14_2_50_65_11]
MAKNSIPTRFGAILSRGQVVGGVALIVLLGAIALDTTAVRIGSDEDIREQAFDPDIFGQEQFPRIREFVAERAPEAADLAQALADDRSAAIEAYGTMAGVFPVMAVRFIGVVGEGRSGIFNVDVDGLSGVTIRVQTGPAINGTELRDVVGDIEFGAFTNQIEYQDAGSGINRAMASDVLDGLEREALSGTTISVTGAFTLINPANWLVTPVALEVQQ